LRNDPAEAAVNVRLAGDDVGQHFAPVPHDGGGRLVAARFDGQDETGFSGMHVPSSPRYGRRPYPPPHAPVPFCPFCPEDGLWDGAAEAAGSGGKSAHMIRASSMLSV